MPPRPYRRVSRLTVAFRLTTSPLQTFLRDSAVESITVTEPKPEPRSLEDHGLEDAEDLRLQRCQLGPS